MSKVGANVTGIKAVNNVFLNRFGISGLAETYARELYGGFVFFFGGGGGFP